MISSAEYHTLKGKTDLSVILSCDITKIVSGLIIALLMLVHYVFVLLMLIDVCFRLGIGISYQVSLANHITKFPKGMK